MASVGDGGSGGADSPLSAPARPPPSQPPPPQQQTPQQTQVVLDWPDPVRWEHPSLVQTGEELSQITQADVMQLLTENEALLRAIRHFQKLATPDRAVSYQLRLQSNLAVLLRLADFTQQQPPPAKGAEPPPTSTG